MQFETGNPSRNLQARRNRFILDLAICPCNEARLSEEAYVFEEI
jgi:hypothetical protein